MKSKLKLNYEAAKDIVNIVNDYFDVSVHEDKSRELGVIIPKHIARYIVKSYCKALSLERIAEIFNVTHATILHSVRVIDDFISVNDSEVVYNLNALLLKVEAESESVCLLGSQNTKNIYLIKISSMLEDFSADRLKEVSGIIRNYKKAYEKVDGLIESPLEVAEA